jgi:predicted PolB exonuclease-like 3'-5' exonuclease
MCTEKRRERGLVEVEAAYKREIMNIAEYLNTNYKGNQFVNIVKNHESKQPNMNSIIKLATKITEYLIQLNGKNDDLLKITFPYIKFSLLI